MGEGVWQGGGEGFGGGGWGEGGLGGGEGQGTFHPPCHILHYHMVLRPEGSSHNNDENNENADRLGHFSIQKLALKLG